MFFRICINCTLYSLQDMNCACNSHFTVYANYPFFKYPSVIYPIGIIRSYVPLCKVAHTTLWYQKILETIPKTSSVRSFLANYALTEMTCYVTHSMRHWLMILCLLTLTTLKYVGINYGDQRVFWFEIIKDVLVSSFRFIWIPMLWVYGH